MSATTDDSQDDPFDQRIETVDLRSGLIAVYISHHLARHLGTTDTSGDNQ